MRVVSLMTISVLRIEHTCVCLSSYHISSCRLFYLILDSGRANVLLALSKAPLDSNIAFTVPQEPTKMIRVLPLVSHVMMHPIVPRVPPSIIIPSSPYHAGQNHPLSNSSIFEGIRQSTHPFLDSQNVHGETFLLHPFFTFSFHHALPDIVVKVYIVLLFVGCIALSGISFCSALYSNIKSPFVGAEIIASLFF